MRYGKAFGKRDPELIEDDVVRILIGVPDAGEESPTQQVPPPSNSVAKCVERGGTESRPFDGKAGAALLAGYRHRHQIPGIHHVHARC